MKTEELYRIYKECRSISTDSRKLVPGSIFFALKGDNFNGNHFALEAIEKGCAYAVVDEPVGSLHATTLQVPYATTLQVPHATTLQVPDVLDALQKLANHHRNHLKIPFIGITGSNGKTTTKELIAAILGRKYKVCATRGNLNNHIGVPLTLLSVLDHDIAVIEMGANHIGEIAALCEIADPDFGIITNIGRAHLEGFGSPEGVIRAKSELFDHLAHKKGKAFVDADNSLLVKLAGEKKLHALLYGNAPESLCTGIVTGNSKFLEAKIHFQGQTGNFDIQTALVGDYNMNNLLAAASIGHFFNVKPAEIAQALKEYKPSNSRSQLMITQKNKIVLDAYNANPNSMEGSIKNFLLMEEELPKMIILGDMLELGRYSQSEHQSIIDLLKKHQFENIILVGPEFCAVSGSSTLPCFTNVEELIEHFRSNPVKEHSILLKGSRGIKLEKLLDVL